MTIPAASPSACLTTTEGQRREGQPVGQGLRSACESVIQGLLKQVWVGNGRSSRPPQPKSPRVCGLHCATVTAHAPAHPSTARRASGVKPLTAGTPPSSRGRKAHNCSPSGGTGGVSPGRAEAHAEDARSALTRRLARSSCSRSFTTIRSIAGQPVTEPVIRHLSAPYRITSSPKWTETRRRQPGPVSTPWKPHGGRSAPRSGRAS